MSFVTLSTHVLDTGKGQPAANMSVILETLDSSLGLPSDPFQYAHLTWTEIAHGVTNSDGRIKEWNTPARLVNSGVIGVGPLKLRTGIYRITFDTGNYFKTNQTSGFYPFAPVIFEMKNPGEHYHVPLLISPYGFSTYRGS